MNEDAFARRFYADRAELESLGIRADRRASRVDGVAEQENYSLRPENFHLPAIAFTDDELAALQTALSLLDGEFAYAEPLRLALQQITWGRPSPLRAPEQRGVALGITASAGGHDLSQRLAKIETAIFRNKTITFDYYTMERDETGARKVDPYHLLFQGGQFYLLGHSHERDALRVFRLSRIRGKVAYATKAEHDFKRARPTSTRARTPTAPTGSSATPSAPPRSASPSASPGRSSATSAASARSAATDGGGDRLFAHRVRDRAPARLLGPAASASTPACSARRARRRARRARRAARRAPRRARSSSPAARPPRRARRRRRPTRNGDRRRARARPRSAPSASRASSRSPRS